MHVHVRMRACHRHASIILAFIGGLQQATAVANNSRPVLAVAGIAVALVGFAAMVSMSMRGATPFEPLGLAVAYGIQLTAELSLLPTATQASMLTPARRAPMVIASLALLACAHNAGAPTTALTAATGVLSLCAMLATYAMRSRAVNPRFGMVAVGTLNGCKLQAVRDTLALYPGTRPPRSYSAFTP